MFSIDVIRTSSWQRSEYMKVDKLESKLFFHTSHVFSTHLEFLVFFGFEKYFYEC